MDTLLRILAIVLNFFRKIFRIIIDSFRSSIRKAITINFLILYIIVSIFVLIGSIFGGIVWTYYNTNFELEQYVYKIKTDSIAKEDLRDYLNDIKEKTGYSVLVQTIDFETNKKNLFKNDSFAINKMPGSSVPDYIKYVAVYMELPVKSYSYNYYNNTHRKIILISVPQRIWLDLIILVAGSVACVQTFGFLIFWILGTLKTRKYLKPIYEINTTAKSISLNNLDSRINVDNVKYELKDLAITLNEMLDRLNKDISKQKKFVSNVSHELRTPVAVIGGYANMLGRWGKEDTEVLNESIDAIKNESENMKLLIENLLFLARHDNQTLQYEKEDTRLDNLLEEIIKDTEIIDRHHEIVSDLEQNISLFVDKMKIKQVLRIFIDNAIKYTPPTGKIYIALKKYQDKVILSIKDTGAGIDKKDLPNIFNRFYRADKSRNRETGGHGLGLSIAKAIVKGHNGKIIVRSKLGEGSEFRIVL